jgi:hypothetical protein
MNRKRLLALADAVESYKHFDYCEPQHCIVGIGERMAGCTTPQQDETQFRKYFDLTYETTERIFFGEWHGIFTDLPNKAMHTYTKEQSAQLLRRLANS